MSYIIEPSKKILLVKPISNETIGGSQIYVTSEGQKAPELGVVEKIGLGKLPLKIKVGDMITYRNFGATKFLIGGKNYVFVEFGDILAIIKKK